MRVSLYTEDEQGKKRVHGWVFQRDGKLMSNPPDHPLLQRILSEPLELPGTTIAPCEGERFLENLHKKYNSPQVSATHLFCELDDADDGIADCERVGWEWPKWESALDSALRKPPRRKKTAPGLFDHVQEDNSGE